MTVETVTTITPGRVETRLRAVRDRGRAALVPYVMGGVSANWTDHLVAYADAGADAVEIGLPFSDPMLDGPVIQQAGDRALARGARPDAVLAELATVSGRLSVPTIVMTYANLVFHPGAQRFCRQLADAGVAGLIVPDVPFDEVDDLESAAREAGIELVQLVAPSTDPRRSDEICRRSRGFVYVVATMGTTGVRERLDPAAARVAAQARQATDLPVLIGFGISTASQAVEAARSADGVVIASALMRRVLDGATPDDVAREVSVVRRALDHSRQDGNAATRAEIPHDRGRPGRGDS
ncbi:MAG: tryptophan synthase subunit alpha [Kineosporiaceae bacterium]|nr:tryptophan synthase subunit alpha [Kineosporiaceae bacterium]